MAREDYPERATPEFWDLLSGAASAREECQHCGRTVYCPTNQDIDDDELADLKADPRAIADDLNDAVFQTTVMGVHCVYGCPCNSAGRLESLLRDNRTWLAQWLRVEIRRLQAEVAAANFE